MQASTFSTSLPPDIFCISGPHTATGLLAHVVAGLASNISVVPLEFPALDLFSSPSSIVETHLVSLSASVLQTTRVPSRVHADRPLEIELTSIEYSSAADAGDAVAHWLSTNVRLTIVVEEDGQPRGEMWVPVSARPTESGWIIRAIARPAAWANAASVTVVSLSFAGRPLPCEVFPIILRVGYNHAPAPTGAVLTAAKAGDVRTLHATLDAGGSTEEGDEVR